MTPTIHYIVDACLLSATTLTTMVAAAWRKASIDRDGSIHRMACSIRAHEEAANRDANFIAEQAESIQSLDGEATSYSIMLTAQQDHLERLEAAYKAAVPERMGNGRFAKKAVS